MNDVDPYAHTGWYAVADQIRGDGRQERVIGAFTDNRHGEGAVVPHEGSVEALLQDPLLTAVVRSHTLDGHLRVSEIELRPRAAGGAVGRAPALCYVVSAEPDASPPAISLVAFAHGFPDGTVLGPPDAAAAGIDPAGQVAALRWLPGSGVVHQVYVAPAWRGRRVATKLLLAGWMLSLAHGWPPLHGGEARTDLGDELIARLPAHWAARVEAKTSAAPPMTPSSG